MALFGWKKKDDEPAGKGQSGAGGSGNGAGQGAPQSGAFEFSPDKGDKFFERAATLHDATNFGYAMNLWLRGLRFDPTSMKGMEGFFRSAGQFFTENPKGEKDDTFKSTAKDLGGRSDLDKYLLSLLEWSAHPVDPTYAAKAMDYAGKLGLPGPSVWVADRVVGATMRDKKPKKENLIAAMNIYRRFDQFDKAVAAGEAAVRLDPTDARLQAEVRNLAAENTMTKGGFDQTGQEGGFRANVRDADKQRQLEEQQRVVTTEEVLDRQVAQARADAEASPNDRPNAIRFIDVLLKRGRPEDEDEALKVADRWHAQSQEYRFREYSDGVRVRQLRRKAAKLKAQADQPGAAESAREAAKQAKVDWIKAQVLSLRGQVEAYPTDLNRKFELGKLLFEIGRHEDAIGLLQEAKADVKNRPRVLFYLGQAFQRIGWNDEAIETLRQAISLHSADADDSGSRELRYSLMEALLARAGDQTAISDAEEAYKIASSIAMQDINYNNGQIRAKRDEIKALVAKFKGGTQG